MTAILQDFLDKIKTGFRTLLADQALFTAILLVLVAVASFGLGRQSVLETREADRQVKNVVESLPTNTETSAAIPATHPTYVASKKGTAYHLLICPGAKQISEANKIYFETKEAAEAAGYRPAANCKGI